MENIFFVSLGCDKNLVDSEMMLGLLREHGFELVSSEEDADVIVVNTCSFICDARDESIETLIEMGQLKAEGRCKVLIAAGCLAQRYKDDILREMPEVDAVIGTASFQHIAEVVKKTLSGEKTAQFDDLSLLPEPDAGRVISAGGYSDYLKIAEGCDKRCTYCIIPSLRGNYRSYPMEYLLSQAEELAGQGIRELNLVAQETTVYGTDIYGKKMLPELLEKLSGIEGISWIRILYCYPEEITDELLRTMSRLPKVCHYLDLPIQHASDRILRMMGRRTNQADIRAVIGRIREFMPDAAIRTTLISGFPGETDEDFRELKDFVREMRFERLGVFAYSQEDGTPAAAMPDQVEESLRAKRREELMLLQQGIAFSNAENMAGRTMDVMIDGRIPEDGVYIGRTYMDAPGVDGCVFIEYNGELISGDIVSVQITGAREYDLIGRLAEDDLPELT